MISLFIRTLRPQLETVIWIWLLVSNQNLVSGFSALAPPATSDLASSRCYDALPRPQISSTAVKTKWLIVGVGIHSVHISARLLGSGVVSSIQDMVIIDGHDKLLHSWKSRTRGTGMEYLRSSAGYHLDLEENSLRLFDQQATSSEDSSMPIAKNRGKNRGSHKDKQRRSLFSNDYERPRLDFFNNHCDEVIAKYNLDQAHTKGFVTKIEPFDDYVKVQVSMGESGEMVDYHAKHIVLALGNAAPCIPAWVDEYDLQNGLVKHLLDDNVAGQSVDDSCKSMKTAIIGGGISAAHKAIQLARNNSSSNGSDTKSESSAIHMISRQPLKEQQFDTHQDWMMDQAASRRSKDGGGYGLPKKQMMYQKCDCLKERRKIIAQERVPGTVTPAVYRGNNGLKYAIQKGEIGWHQAYVVDKERVQDENGNEQILLQLSCGESIQVDKVLLATGFDKTIPGGKMIQNLIDNSGLKVSEYCGYPVVSKHLRWSDRVFVAGALAELELGPSARNVAGARLAAERILQAFERA